MFMYPGKWPLHRSPPTENIGHKGWIHLLDPLGNQTASNFHRLGGDRPHCTHSLVYISLKFPVNLKDLIDSWSLIFKLRPHLHVNIGRVFSDWAGGQHGWDI